MPPSTFSSFAAVWPIILNTSAGVRQLDRRRPTLARSLSATRREILWKIVIPGSLGHILTGLRLAIGIVWIILVPCEMLGVSSGLGYFILDTRDRLAYSEPWPTSADRCAGIRAGCRRAAAAPPLGARAGPTPCLGGAPRKLKLRSRWSPFTLAPVHANPALRVWPLPAPTSWSPASRGSMRACASRCRGRRGTRLSPRRSGCGARCRRSGNTGCRP
ncbi:hypothetical protein CDEF62S_04827 [Castellaniella defragrans]